MVRSPSWDLNMRSRNKYPKAPYAPPIYNRMDATLEKTLDKWAEPRETPMDWPLSEALGLWLGIAHKHNLLEPIPMPRV